MRKKGRKKWAIAERMGGFLPGDEHHEGGHSFIFAHLFKNGPPGISDEERKAIDAQGPSALEECRNLDDDGLWALDYLTKLFRFHLLTGDSKSISRIGTAMEYRKRFFQERESRKHEPNLEYRLYEIAFQFRARHPERRFPTRREAKEIALDQLESSWIRRRARHSPEELSTERERQRKSLPWTKAFKSLTEFGLYISPGKPGAPKSNGDRKGRK
jgi:hypothetical protein